MIERQEKVQKVEDLVGEEEITVEEIEVDIDK